MCKPIFASDFGVWKKIRVQDSKGDSFEKCHIFIGDLNVRRPACMAFIGSVMNWWYHDVLGDIAFWLVVLHD